MRFCILSSSVVVKLTVVEALFWYIVVEPRSTRDIEILFKLTVKVPVVGNTADSPNAPGLLPF